MNCTICERNMESKDGTNIVGFHTSINKFKEDISEQFYEVYPELKGITRLDLCYVCWIKSMGGAHLIKPL